MVPDIPPSFDPEKMRTGDATPVLSEYLLLEVHVCRLEAQNDRPIPIHLPDEESSFMEPLSHVHPGLVEELKQYVRFFNPSVVEVSFDRPNVALSGMPTRVLVELDDSCKKTACFFEGFGAGECLTLEKELEAHLRVFKSQLVPEARVVRLLGVVAVEDGRVAGLLLTYVELSREYDAVMQGYGLRYAPMPARERWVKQIGGTVQQLHDAGVVWGNAKAENVLIDKNNDT